jgi:hypothetical protein
MSSCGSSGYFSSSPTLSSSPPVLCNPKSGEWENGGHAPVWEAWGHALAGGVPRDVEITGDRISQQHALELAPVEWPTKDSMASDTASWKDTADP